MRYTSITHVARTVVMLEQKILCLNGNLSSCATIILHNKGSSGERVNRQRSPLPCSCLISCSRLAISISVRCRLS